MKVSGGARTLAGVQRHMKYIEKKGAFGLEIDMGSRAEGPAFASDLVKAWDLDVEALNHYSKKTFRGKPPKLVHNLIFSMPAGTSTDIVLGAVRKLALNEWALEHRYVMALHTDTPRPHVHVAVKAMSEQGIRLNIKKSTLRQWRAQFAENLREFGVAANATERAVRGETRSHKRTEIHRAAMRNDSSYIRRFAASAMDQSRTRALPDDPGQIVMERTRQLVTASWRAISLSLRNTNDINLAAEVDSFVGRMAPARTEQSALAEHIRSATRSPNVEL